MPEQPPHRVLSLTLRLAGALVLLLGAGGAAVAVAAVAYGRNAAEQSYDRLLVGAASQIAEALTLRDGAISIDIPATAFELLALAPQDRIAYAVLDPKGHLITGYDGLDGPKPGQAFGNGTFTGEAMRFAAVDRRFAERSFSGTVQVVVERQLEQDFDRQTPRNVKRADRYSRKTCLLRRIR